MKSFSPGIRVLVWLALGLAVRGAVAPRIESITSGHLLSIADLTPGEVVTIERSPNLAPGSWSPFFYDQSTQQVRTLQLPSAGGPVSFYRLSQLGRPTDTNLVMHLSFDNMLSNGIVVDVSGHGNHGLRYGKPASPTNWPIATIGPDGSQAGLFRNYFDGWATYKRSGDYIGIRKSPTISGLTQATVSLWVSFFTAPNGNILLDQTATFFNSGYIDKGTWSLGRDYANYSSLVVMIAPYSGARALTFPDVFPTGNSGGWHHYAFTFDRGTFVGYFDGEECSRSTLSVVDQLVVAGSFLGIACWTFNETAEMNLAVDEHPNNGWMNGAMDDIRIYSRPLRAEEIAKLYREFDRESPGVPSRLVARGSSARSAELRWLPAQDNFRVAGYRVYRDGGVLAEIPGTLLVDSNLVAETEYSYSVEAYDLNGNHSAASSPVVLKTPPTGGGFEAILDEQDSAPWVTRVGVWSLRTNAQAYGTLFIQDDNAGKGTKSVEYRPWLPESGTYAVSMWHPYRPNGATKASVDIVTPDRQSTVVVNHTQNGGKWNLLGNFLLPAGTNTVVRLRNDDASGYVQADAVRFVKSP